MIRRDRSGTKGHRNEGRDVYRHERHRMVRSQLQTRDITDARVLKVMEQIPRHLFVPEALRTRAYDDNPLPIGHNQTISQPYIVALMTQALRLKGDEKVLEIGTGSGYQTAILANLAEQVFTIERNKELMAGAVAVLENLKLYNVVSRIMDGTYGWKDAAPFDGILVTAGSPDVPDAYVEQLAPKGRLVIPVGGAESQDLLVITSDRGKVHRQSLGGCRFVKLIGKYGWKG